MNITCRQDGLCQIAHGIIGVLRYVPLGVGHGGPSAQRIIGIGADSGWTALRTRLTRDVLAVTEHDLTRAAGGLRKQIANAVIAMRLSRCCLAIAVRHEGF